MVWIVPPQKKGGRKTRSDGRSTPRSKVKLGPTIEPNRVMEPNRVKNIISAIEENIQLNVADTIKSEVNKCTAVNAFKKLMDKNGGEISPSPGRRKKKRLIRDKPHGQKSLDGWLKNEKI